MNPSLRLGRFRKLFAALIPVIIFVATNYGIDLGEGWEADALAAFDAAVLLATPFLVYFVRNDPE